MPIFKIFLLISVFIIAVWQSPPIFAKKDFYGDIRGTANHASVVKVGEQTAHNIAQSTKLVNNSTSHNTPNTLVKRDEMGNFTTNQITLTGTPTDDIHVITKTYVDQAISQVLEQINSIASNQSIQLAIPTNSGSIHANSNTSILILKNTNNVSGYTIYFPANPTDGQFFMILLGTSNNVTSITNSTNINSTAPGKAIINPITSLNPGATLSASANGVSVTYLYVASTNSWYRFHRE